MADDPDDWPEPLAHPWLNDRLGIIVTFSEPSVQFLDEDQLKLLKQQDKIDRARYRARGWSCGFGEYDG